MDIYELLGKSQPEAVAKDLAKKFLTIRKNKHLTREKLSSMSFVPYATIRVFETQGKISLISLLKLASALDIIDDLNNCFVPSKHRTYQELENEAK